MPIGTGLPIPKAGDELIQPPGIASGGDFGASSWARIAQAGEQVAKAGLATSELAVAQRLHQEKIGETAGADLMARKTNIDLHATYAATPKGPDADAFWKASEEAQAKYVASLPTPEAQEHARKVWDQNKLNVYGALKNQQTQNTLNNANENLTARTKMASGDIVAAAQAGTLLDPATGDYTPAGKQLIDEHKSILQSAVTSQMKPQSWADSQIEDTVGQGMGIALGRTASEKARAGDIQGAYDDIDNLVNKNENLKMSPTMRTKVVGQAKGIVQAQAQAFRAELGELKTRAQGAIEAYNSSGASSVPLADHDATVDALRKHGDYHTADKLERSRGAADYRDGNLKGTLPTPPAASTRTAPEPQAPVPSGKTGRQGVPIVQGAIRLGPLPVVRQRFGQEMAADPALVNRFIAYTLAEPEKGHHDTPQAQLGFIETTLNRATDYQQSLSDTIPTTGRKTIPGQYFPIETHMAVRRPPTQEEIARIKPMIEAALAGANTTKLGTGNASGPVGLGWGRGALDPFTLFAARERFGPEKANAEWVRDMSVIVGQVDPTTGGPTVATTTLPFSPSYAPGPLPGSAAAIRPTGGFTPAIGPEPSIALAPLGGGPAATSPVPLVAPAPTITDPTRPPEHEPPAAAAAAAAPTVSGPGGPAAAPAPMLQPAVVAAADARAQGYYAEREKFYKQEFPNLDKQIKNNNLTADSAAQWIDVARHSRDVKFRDGVFGSIAAWQLNTDPRLIDAQTRQSVIDNITASAKNYPQDYATQLLDNLRSATADRSKMATDDPVTLHLKDGGNPVAQFGDFSDANQVATAIQQHRVAAEAVATSAGRPPGDMLREPDKAALVAAIQSKNPVRMQNAFTALTMMTNEELHATLNNNGEPSKNLKNTIVAQLHSTDGNAIAASGMALAAIHQRDALAFKEIFGKDAYNLVDAWGNNRSLRTPEDMAALNAKRGEPGFAVSQDEHEKGYGKEFRDKNKLPDIMREFAGFFSIAPERNAPANIPDVLDKNVNNDQKAALMSAVENEYVLMRSLGNDEAGARQKAVERIQRVWGYSNANNGNLMRWAPDNEKIHAPVNGSYKWQQDQLTQVIDLTKGQQPVVEQPGALGALRRIVTEYNQKQLERERLAGIRGEPLPQQPTRITTGAPEGEVAGLQTAGNIDLTARPVVRTAEGKPATTRSISIEEDGKTVLIPTVIQPKEGQAKVVSNEEAVKHYHATGEHLGIFDTRENADKYATELSKAQAVYYKRQIEVPSLPEQRWTLHSLYSDPQTEREVAAWKANPNVNPPPSYKVFVTNPRTSQIELLVDDQGRETRIRFDREVAQREAEMKARGLAPLTSLSDFWNYAAGPRYRAKLNIMEDQAAQAGPPRGTFPRGPATGDVPDLPDQARELPNVRATTTPPPERGGFGGAGASYPPRGLAEGGHVAADEEVVVGEKGPEKFVPDVPGTIVPNADFMAGDLEGIKGLTPAQQVFERTAPLYPTGDKPIDPIIRDEHILAALSRRSPAQIRALMGSLKQIRKQQKPED